MKLAFNVAHKLVVWGVKTLNPEEDATLTTQLSTARPRRPLRSAVASTRPA